MAKAARLRYNPRTMKISRDWLLDFIDLSGVSDEAVAAKLTEIGHAVEAIESHDGDAVFEIEFTTNRVDAMSHLGVARELGAALGLALKPLPDVPAPAGSATIAIRIDAPQLCSRYTGLVIRGVKVGPSSPKVQRRLEAVGLRPINNVVDATNYVMMALGHPLHAFDLDRLEGPAINVRAAGPGEVLKTLDGSVRKLDPEMVVIADAKQGVALGGVMGGGNSEISDTTTNVLLECAHFNPSSIRRASRRLGLFTDASYRFERGADPGDTVTAIEQAAAQIVAEGGGTRSGAIDTVGRTIEPKKIALRRSHLETASAGLIDLEFCESTFSRLGMMVSRSDDMLEAIVPSWRGDIGEEIDLIEEALRFYGFNRIPSTLPRVTTGDVRRNLFVETEDQLRNLLAGCGLTEVVTYSFIHPSQNALFSEERSLDVTNSLTENISSMRLSMLPGLLQAVGYNWSYGIRDGGVFEVGRTYHRDGESVKERHVATFLMFGNPSDHWTDRGRSVDYFDAKGVVEVVARAFHVELSFARDSRAHFADGMAAVATVRGTRVASIGVLRKDVARAFEIGGNVSIVAGEIDLGALVESVREWKMEPVSKFPGVPMVVAMLHKPELEYAAIVETIKAMNIPHLREVGVWDRFVPEKGDGSVKTALGLWYQALDRSLTQDEVVESNALLVRGIQEKLPVRLLA